MAEANWRFHKQHEFASVSEGLPSRSLNEHLLLHSSLSYNHVVLLRIGVGHGNKKNYVS